MPKEPKATPKNDQTRLLRERAFADRQAAMRAEAVKGKAVTIPDPQAVHPGHVWPDEKED